MKGWRGPSRNNVTKEAGGSADTGTEPGATGSTVRGLFPTPGGLGGGRACCWGEGPGPQHLHLLSSIYALGTRTRGYPPGQGDIALDPWKVS